MKKIELTKNKFAIVDDEDYSRVSKITWCALNVDCKWYGSNSKRGLMHRYILGEKCAGNEVDHINGDGLDNRKENLRVCTHAQNMMNRKMHKNNKSGYKGVYRAQDRNLWRAQIKFNNKIVHLGSYKTPIEASFAYEHAAKQYFGDFASINGKP